MAQVCAPLITREQYTVNPYASALLSDDKSCERYFQREWFAVDAARSLRIEDPDLLAQWYDRALWRGYSLPPSMLQFIAQALQGMSPGLPEYAWEDGSRARYLAFLDSLRNSDAGKMLQNAQTSQTVFSATGPANWSGALWDSVLLMLGKEELLFLPVPLYPPQWLRNRLCREASPAEVGDVGDVSPRSDFFTAISDRIRQYIPDAGDAPHPFFFPFQKAGEPGSDRRGSTRSNETIPGHAALAGLAQRTAVLGRVFPSWSLPERSTNRFNEIVAAKYVADHRLDEDAEIRKRRSGLELTVKTSDPERFCKAIELIAVHGILLPSEVAMDWDLFCKKFLEGTLLRLTSCERERAPVHMHIQIQTFLGWEDEATITWDGITRSDHLHALALLIAHDIIFYFARVPSVHVNLTLAMNRMHGKTRARTAKVSVPARNLVCSVDGTVPTCVSGSIWESPFLLAFSESLPWFRNIEMFADPRPEVRTALPQDPFPEHQQMLNVVVRGVGQPFGDMGLGPGSLRLNVANDDLTLDQYEGGHWVPKKGPEHIPAKGTPPQLWLESYWRTEVLLLLLGHKIEMLEAQHIGASR